MLGFTEESSDSRGQLNDDVILLQLPESFSLLYSCANSVELLLFTVNLRGIDKFK